jgi:isopentenyldiphosphate isomerase
MVAVKGIYEGGNTVKIDDSEFTATEPCEVVITFLRNAKNADDKRLEEEKKVAKWMNENDIVARGRTTRWFTTPWKTPDFKALKKEEIAEEKRAILNELAGIASSSPLSLDEIKDSRLARQ